VPQPPKRLVEAASAVLEATKDLVREATTSTSAASPVKDKAASTVNRGDEAVAAAVPATAAVSVKTEAQLKKQREKNQRSERVDDRASTLLMHILVAGRRRRNRSASGQSDRMGKTLLLLSQLLWRCSKRLWAIPGSRNWLPHSSWTRLLWQRCLHG
jgi:sugar-specific transcriptional regulator TrmB